MWLCCSYRSGRKIQRLLHGKSVWFLFTSFFILHNEWIKIVQSTFHVVICLLYECWDYGISMDMFIAQLYTQNYYQWLEKTKKLSICISKIFVEKYIVTRINLMELICSSSFKEITINNQFDSRKILIRFPSLVKNIVYFIKRFDE